MQKNKEIKFLQSVKIRKLLSSIIYSIAVIAILYNIIFLIHKTITKKEYLEIFGISFLSMNENLMRDDLNKNDLVITKQVDKKDVNIGDIIAYNINGKIRINKVVNIYYDEDICKEVYITKSNKNIQPDIEPIQINQIIGKKIVNVFGIGLIIKILQTKFISIISLIILCVGYLYNGYMYNKKKERSRKLKRNSIKKDT